MKIVKLKDVPEVENASSLFTAPVTMQNAVSENDADYNVSYVHFPDGVMNKFHTHSHDQVLIVTQGRGMVATEAEEKDIEEGDIVLVKAGEKHKHGAKTGSPMTHITITAAGTKLDQLEE